MLSPKKFKSASSRLAESPKLRLRLGLSAKLPSSRDISEKQDNPISSSWVVMENPVAIALDRFGFFFTIVLLGFSRKYSVHVPSEKSVNIRPPRLRLQLAPTVMPNLSEEIIGAVELTLKLFGSRNIPEKSMVPEVYEAPKQKDYSSQNRNASIT